MAMKTHVPDESLGFGSARVDDDGSRLNHTYSIAASGTRTGAIRVTPGSMSPVAAGISSVPMVLRGPSEKSSTYAILSIGSSLGWPGQGLQP